MTASFETSLPDSLPLLGRGKHRTARRGACFMEYASVLAGERWSDHPSCTHPLLASVARLVNDNTPDGDRQALAPLVPSVVGLNGPGVVWDVTITRRAAACALPTAPERRQRALAVGLLVCERILAVHAPHAVRSPGTLDPISATALASAPLTWAWARRFSGESATPSPSAFRKHAAPAIVLSAVAGVAEACVADTSGALRSLLAAVIDDCRTLAGADASAVPVPGAAPAPAVAIAR